MNDNFSEQKEKLIAIHHEISLLRQQVSYLLRNEKPLGLLDLDVLMNRTHTLYDMLCAIQVNDNADDEELELDAEAFAGLFGDMSQEETEEHPDVEEEMEEVELTEEKTSEEAVTEEETPEETPMEAAEEEVFAEDETPVVAEPEAEEILATEESVAEEPEVFEPVMESIEEEPFAEEPDAEEPKVESSAPESDEFGLFFRFEDEPQPEQQEELPFEPQSEPQLELHPEPQPKQEPVPFVDRPVVTDDGKVVHFVEEIPEENIPARDLVDGDELLRDNPFDMPRMEDGTEEEGFELTQPETLGESLMHEDHSLAARLQQNPVRDLKSVIGINDKFLFVNELFGGSMEKYNKSIENLNDLKTLNGAMIYLNELKVELQWNSSNEAYQKLNDLVRRKFD